MEEKHKKEERTEKYYTPIAIIIAALIIATPIVMLGNDITGKLTTIAKNIEKIKIETTQPTQNDTQETAETIKLDFEKLKDDDAMKGQKDAKVTIIEFSDFQCPFCKRFYDNAYKQIVKDYIETGKANIVFRDFPLNSIHPQAQKAAEAAECAGDFGKFWEMHDKLFENQTTLSTDNYKKWAQELGIDKTKFDECLDKGKYAQEVNKDLQDGANIGITGTPSFVIVLQNTEKVKQALTEYKNKNPQYAGYINEIESTNDKLFGVIVIGARPYEVFKGIIEAGQA
ncbi:MAG: thioredoxin domain-containing protein [Candidatus Diapherotrites archaeon]